jgi:hypothetical protein
VKLKWHIMNDVFGYHVRATTREGGFYSIFRSPATGLYRLDRHEAEGDEELNVRVGDCLNDCMEAAESHRKARKL